jgi:hypothetical protein
MLIDIIAVDLDRNTAAIADRAFREPTEPPRLFASRTIWARFCDATHANGRKEGRSAGDPTVAVAREATAGNDAMQVWMMESVRPQV